MVSGQKKGTRKDLVAGWEEVDRAKHRVVEKLTEAQCWGRLEAGRDGWEGRRTGGQDVQQRLVWNSWVNVGRQGSASKRLLCPFLRPEECELQAEGGWCGFIIGSSAQLVHKTEVS